MTKLRVELFGRDYIEVEYEGEDPLWPGALKRVNIVGCANFMDMMQSMRKNFGPDVTKWPLPEASDHSSLLLRELILKLRGEWHYPYGEDELCHCRSIPTQTVDQAIIAGAHTPEIVTRQTSASTACGTCRPNVQRIIDFRLGKKQAS